MKFMGSAGRRKVVTVTETFKRFEGRTYLLVFHVSVSISLLLTQSLQFFPYFSPTNAGSLSLSLKYFRHHISCIDKCMFSPWIDSPVPVNIWQGKVIPGYTSFSSISLPLSFGFSLSLTNFSSLSFKS